ncbi:type VII secretion target [Rhodococcus oryzae]|uniref:type VII secretion target n=1 Tax=Rhodococcus oryzae TaxID=2571143 RepID=UPI0037881097
MGAQGVMRGGEMADFRVNPDDLDKFAATLADLATQASQAEEYLNKWLQIGYAEGRLFAPVVEKVSDVLSTLTPAYATLTMLSGDAGNELGRAANSYRATDGNTAGQLDASYQES